MKRRDFVTGGTKGALVGLAGLAGLGARPAAPSVTGTGSRADGAAPSSTGEPPRAWLSPGPHQRVGQVAATGSTEIDARGMAVGPASSTSTRTPTCAPGQPAREPRAAGRHPGGGRPGRQLDRPVERRRLRVHARRYRRNYDVEIDFRDIGGFLDRIDRERPAVSVASMIGHGTVRGYVTGGADRPATDAELAQMRALVRDGLAAGAVGLSTGLEYTPGSFATRDELIALATELRGTPYPYASHMRNEDDRLRRREEALHVGLAGVRHLKAQGQRNYSEAALAAIEAARDGGVDVHFDRYPYVAYGRGSRTSSPPRRGPAARRGSWNGSPIRRADRRWNGPAGPRSRCWDPGTRFRSRGSAAAYARGRRLGELAAERGEDPYGAAPARSGRQRGHDRLRHGGEPSAHPVTLRLARRTLRSRSPCTRSRAFPRGSLAWTTAQGRGRRRCRGFRSRQRGRRATFEDPHQYPVGIPHVVVSGVHTIRRPPGHARTPIHAAQRATNPVLRRSGGSPRR